MLVAFVAGVASSIAVVAAFIVLDKKKNISITDTDAIILYSYAKNHYQEILDGNDKLVIKELRNKLNSNTFKEAYKLYLEYKIKYLS